MEGNLPILKWPGGKRWFVKHLVDLMPEQYERFIEPFFGGGSAFFAVSPNKALLTDINKELITTYRLIRDDWEFVEQKLKKFEKKHSTDFYYKIRGLAPENNCDIGLRMLYLNRTCFNGIYRVNVKGEFNVPIGSKEKVVLDSDDFQTTSRLLKKATLLCCDFEKSVDKAVLGDVIFADPPYTVRHNLNGFIKYNEKLFSWDDQVRLADSLERAKDRGVTIISTNANHESVRRLYRERGFALKTLSRYSSISADPASRNQFKELIITS